MVTLARSVAHLSSEMRTQHLMFQVRSTPHLMFQVISFQYIMFQVRSTQHLMFQLGMARLGTRRMSVAYMRCVIAGIGSS